MAKKLQFQHHFHIEIVQPKTVYLISELTNYVLTGSLYCQLAPLLNGNFSLKEIMEQLQGKFSAAVIYYTLNALQTKGYVTEVNDTLNPEFAAFWSLLGMDAKEALEKLKIKSVYLTSFGAVATEPLRNILKKYHLNTIDIEEAETLKLQADLVVVLTDDYLQLGLDKFNKQMLNKQQPWLLIKPRGAIVWMGPLFYPGKTGCWQCLAHRLQHNRELESFIQKQQQSIAPFPIARAALDSTVGSSLHLAATEILKWLVLPNYSRLQGQIISLDLLFMSMQDHTLVKRPQCPKCQDLMNLSKSNFQPLTLNSRKKQFKGGCGYRSCSPEQTLLNYQHHISSISGIVKFLVRLSDPTNSMVNLYVAAQSAGFSDISLTQGDTLDTLKEILYEKCAGKGLTDIEAKVSALCEAIEVYSGVYTGEESCIRGAYSQIGDAAIHPNSCLLFSNLQYQSQQQWNKKYNNQNQISQPFDIKKEIDWTPVWSLTERKTKYLPTAYCYYNYPLPADHRFCVVDTTGQASGNTIEEAIFHAFMELVERDSIALWWYNRIKRPAVNLDSFRNPSLEIWQDFYQQQQREFWVLDITSDLNIPTFVAVSLSADRLGEKILLGYGTDFDPNIALTRAITEINQSLLETVASEGVPGKAKDIPIITDWSYLTPDPDLPCKNYSDYSHLWHDDIKEDVVACVEVVRQKGMEVLVLDQTRPDIGLSVARVIVPGLRPRRPRFAPGRLYDVPVKLGWLSKPLKEAELNPIPLFL